MRADTLAADLASAQAEASDTEAMIQSLKLRIARPKKLQQSALDCQGISVLQTESGP